MTDALRPCRCGGTPEYGGEALFCAVRCTNCGLTVCKVIASHETSDVVRDEWNRRAEPVSVQEAARVLLDDDGYLRDYAIHAACYCAEIDETRAIVALREGLRALAADKKE